MAAKTSTPTHSRKRQYQPSISAYFTSRHADSSPHSSPKPTSSPSLAPVLPAETQSMLLNVGMRVRKAVPEGYKTHKTVPTTSLDSYTLPIVPSTAPAMTTIMQPRNVNPSYPRELTPFCGLHKIGGLAAQENWNPASSDPALLAHQTDHNHDVAEVPGLSFSQSTLSSTQSSFSAQNCSARPTPGKRAYEEDMEAEMDAFFDQMDDEAATQQHETVALSARRIAKPRNHAARKATPHVNVANDFEDAVFLAPPDGMDMDRDFQF